MSLLMRGRLLLPFRPLRTSVRNKFTDRVDYWGYREAPYRPWDHLDSYCERIMGGLFWWWIIHHFVHDYQLITGHFPYHYPHTEWTDAELGVPDDSEGLAPTIENVRSTEVPGCTRHQLYIPPLLMQLQFGDKGWWKF